MPFCNIHHFTFGKLKTPLRSVSPETVDNLMGLLTRLVNDTIRRLSLIIPGDSPHCGPSRPYKIEAACRAWSLDGRLVVSMENHLPLRQLDLLPDFPPTPSMWTAEYTWNRYVLPGCTDVKVRLQHNALGVRYKFKRRTEVNMSTTCINGCIDVEDAKHLFKDCHVASYQWNYYLKPFEELFEELYGVSAIQVVLNIIIC
ncbi:hypothetical protein Plhal304r1_c035g0108801 [Plasmopara halstedii]